MIGRHFCCRLTWRPPRPNRTLSYLRPRSNFETLQCGSRRNYSFLTESNRWKQLIVDHDETGPIDLIAVPLRDNEWESLIENLGNSHLKLWLQEQRGVIRLLPDMVQEISDTLWLTMSDQVIFPFIPTQIMLIRLEKETNYSHSCVNDYELRPPNKSMEVLSKANAGILSEPCMIVLPPDSLLNENEMLQSFLLSSYTFHRYRSHAVSPAKSRVLIAEPTPSAELSALVSSIYWCQDLISTPARDLSPATLQQAAQEWVDTQSSSVTMECIIGDDLMSYNGALPTNFGCGMIHAVGQAAMAEDRLPRLIRMQYKPSKDPSSLRSIALVGKGVTFDTGGLNLKPGDSMITMKKDMAGAAHAMSLFRLLVETNYPLPVQLVLPIVENVIGSYSYRPGDILTAVNGTTTEIGNTDAEGRLILGDALALAAADSPSVIIDFATLTGAARTALGTELPALFTNQPGHEVHAMLKAAHVARDPIWPLPLFEGYRSRMKGKIADYGNIAHDGGLGGAITAALYLSEFVDQVPWYHLDLHGLDKDGKGRAQGLQAIYQFLKDYSCVD